MSFDLCVIPHQQANSKPPDPSSDEFDAWQHRMDEAYLFDAPLGADQTVWLYWSGVARTLDLPLLARIYELGLRLDTPSELDAVASELDRIEAGWQSLELPDPGPLSALRGYLREHLSERLAFFREAIRIAREHGAVLLVS